LAIEAGGNIFARARNNSLPLDQLQPSQELVETVVTEGIDIMPAYGDILSEEQIRAVAHYVATVAGQQ
jgi:cytochrome c6